MADSVLMVEPQVQVGALMWMVGERFKILVIISGVKFISAAISPWFN